MEKSLKFLYVFLNVFFVIFFNHFQLSDETIEKRFGNSKKPVESRARHQFLTFISYAVFHWYKCKMASLV